MNWLLVVRTWCSSLLPWWTRVVQELSHAPTSCTFSMYLGTQTLLKVVQPAIKFLPTSWTSLTELGAIMTVRSPLMSSLTTTEICRCLCPRTTTSSWWWSQPGKCLRRRTLPRPSRLSRICWEKLNRGSLSWLEETPTYCAKSSMTLTWTRVARWPSTRWLTLSLSCKSLLSASTSTPSSKWLTRTIQAGSNMKSSKVTSLAASEWNSIYLYSL